MELDSGYAFGIGAFETIYVHDGNLVFLDMHLQRMTGTLKFLDIEKTISERDISHFLDAEGRSYHEFVATNGSFFAGSGVLKLMVSEKNNLFSVRENPYNIFDEKSNFELEVSHIDRNEKSEFVNHKTFNYGENLFLKRNAISKGFDDYLFLNSRGNVAETTTGNIFFTKSGKLFTPRVEDGILPGIMREFVVEKFANVSEMKIGYSDVKNFDEAFVTNSLMGIMPVSRIGEITFTGGEVTESIRNIYAEYLSNL